MNINDVLKYGHQTVLAAIDGLPEAKWHSPNVCGVWSVREILAHLASYEEVLIGILGGLQGEKETPALTRLKELGPERFNDVEVADRKGMTAAEVLIEYQKSCEQTMRMVRHLDVEITRQAGVLPWYGEEYDLEDFVVYSFYGHKREHCAQINVFRDQFLFKSGG